MTSSGSFIAPTISRRTDFASQGRTTGFAFHTLILPLLVLSVTFSSKPVYPDAILHHIISATFILCAIFVFYRASKNSVLAVTVPAAVVLLRIARILYGDINEPLELIYFVPYSVLMLGVGAKMLRDHPLLMLRQICWICTISIGLSVLQITGVQWAQALTNYYWYEGGTTDAYLFARWSELPPPSGIQMRPVGFAHANNVVSQYLLFFYAFAILWFVDNSQRHRLPLIAIFTVSLACALTGAKVVITSVLLINITALLLLKHRMQVVRAFLITSSAYGVYWVFFPGLATYNFNVDLFAFNLAIRLTSLTETVSMPFVDSMVTFLSQYQTGEFIGERSVAEALRRLDGAVITGVQSVIGYLPVVILIGFMLLPFWFTRLRKLARIPHIDIRKVPIVMLVTSIASSAGGPFLFTSYFWFFFSFALYPLSVLLLRAAPRESSGHRIQAASLSLDTRMSSPIGVTRDKPDWKRRSRLHVAVGRPATHQR